MTDDEKEIIAEADIHPYQLDIRGCARCGGFHEKLIFYPLTRPANVWTHYAMCPTNSEPIMFRFAPMSEESDD